VRSSQQQQSSAQELTPSQ